MRHEQGTGLRVVLAARPGERRTAAASGLTDAGCTVNEIDFEATDENSRKQVVEEAFAEGDVDLAVVAFGILGDAERAWTDPDHALRSNFVYGSTKAGFYGFYLGLGEALRPFGARVLVVRPGFVRSKMTAGMAEAPLAVTPEEVAAATIAAIRDRKELIWVPNAFRYVMSGLRHVPRPLFRRLPI
jgi:decaprenylphospho-beta-D-erythro-pentofuranosid-2-ulose 2-reductase